MMQQKTDRATLFVLGSFVVACTAKVDRLPRAGESLAATDFALEPGGKGLNLVVAARRLGAAVDGLIAIGDDDLGRMAEPALVRAGLPSGMLRRHAGPTGAGVGFIAANGENCLAVRAGANLSLSAEDARARADAIEAADLTLAQFEIGDAPILAAFILARGAGRRTLLNPSPFRTPAPAVLAATSVVVVNTPESAALAAVLGVAWTDDVERSAAELAAALFTLGPTALVVTRGAEGALAFLAGEPPVAQAAFAVDAVDAVGAGDAFAAGLAASLAEHRGWAESLRRAAGCGALVASTFGVFDALPTRAALEAFLADPRRTG